MRIMIRQKEYYVNGVRVQSGDERNFEYKGDVGISSMKGAKEDVGKL